MNACRWIVASLALGLLAGCQARRQNDLVERELRMQEDRIYSLQGYIERYQEMLDSCRRENESLRRELGESPPSADFNSPSDSGAPLVDPTVPLEPPGVEFGEPLQPEAPQELPEGAALTLPPSDTRLVGEEQTLDGPEEVTDQEIESIAFNRMLTGGLDEDGRPGDEGVLVALEARNASGQIVRGQGALSLMVVDPALPAANWRVAQWEFTADEANAAWQKTLFGQGLYFELPWPNQPPLRNKLRVYARLITFEGKKLLAKTEIEIDLLGEGLGSAGLPQGSFPPEASPAMARQASWDQGPAPLGGWSPSTLRIPAVAEPSIPLRQMPPAKQPGARGKTSPRPSWSPLR